MQKLQRYIADHGILSLIFAVIALISASQLDWGVLPLFTVPTLCALAFSRLKSSRIADAFLFAIGLASIVAHLSWILPHLGHNSNNVTPKSHDRLVLLYLLIYFIWIVAVLPIHLFGGSLKALRERRSARFSKFTCYLGLATAGLLWCIALPSLAFSLYSIGLLPLL